MVIIPAVDRLSCDTTDLLVIAREMRKTGAGIRSLAEPFLDTTSDFAEIVLAISELPQSSNIAASRNEPRETLAASTSAKRRFRRPWGSRGLAESPRLL